MIRVGKLLLVACCLSVPVTPRAALAAAPTSAPHANPPVPASSDRPFSIGLMPVNVSGGNERSAKFRGLIESSMDMAAARLRDVDIVDRSRIDSVLKELTYSKLGRQDLQAGQIVGAEILLAASLSHVRDELILELSALETATGNVLLNKKSPVGDEVAANAAVAAFVAGLPAKLVRRPHLADVALLTITHASPFPVKGELAEDLRRRLSEKVGTLPGVRVLNRELGQFVLVESQLAAAGLVDSRRKFAPVAATIAISGKLSQELANGQTMDQSSLRLELTVTAGKSHKVVRASGTLASAAEMELHAAKELCAAVAELARTAAPDISLDERDRRYWEAQKYLAIARPMINMSDWKDPKNAAAVELLTRAAALIPDSPEPYAVVSEFDLLTVMSAGLRGDRGETPLSALRRRVIDGFPRHPLWPHAVMVEQYALLGSELAGPLKADQVATMIGKFGKESYERALDLAVKLADATIDGRNVPWDVSPAFLAIRLLLLDGQYDKALRMCIAPSANRRAFNRSLALNAYVLFALDIGQLDWAFQAAQVRRASYPGRPLEWLELSGRRAKIQASAQLDRWKPILEEVDRKEASQAKAEVARRLPAWGRTCLVERQELGNLDALHVPEGTVMSVSSQGGPLLAVLRNGNKYLLWTLPDGKPLEMVGLPPLVPPNQLLGYVMRPAIASFDGRVYVGAEHLGLFEVDAASGKTARIAGGFPDGSVHALVAAGDSLYAAGGGKDAGFIARRQAGKPEWRIWMAPKPCGPIWRVAPQTDGAWRIYHGEQQRLSLFDPASGRWDEGFSVKQYAFDGDGMASDGRRTMTFSTAWDTQHPIYLFSEEDKKTLRVFFPPGDLSEYSAILQRHEVFWGLDGQRDATVAPLAQHPVDAVVADGCFWILDAAGGLTATRDGRSFAGPFMVAKGGTSMGRTDKALYVVSNNRLVTVVPLELLAKKLAQPGAFRDWKTVLATVKERLSAWVNAQPALEQTAYFNKIDRPDLAARVVSAHPEIPREAADRTLSEQAAKLVMNKKYAQALALLGPHVADPRKIIEGDLEWSYLWGLHGVKKWDKLLDVVPRLWQVTALSDRGSREERLNAYFAAVQATASMPQFEKVLWDHIMLRLPAVPWRWNENALAEQEARQVRNVAADWLRRHLKSQGRLKEIEGNPLLPDREGAE